MENRGENTAATSLRDLNRAAALSAIFEGGELTRNQIVAQTGISSPSVSRIIVELLDEGYIEEGDAEDRAGVGRRSHPLRVARGLGFAIGLDLNVYMARMVVVDLAGSLRASVERETPSDRSPVSLADWIGDWVTSVVAEHSVDGAELLRLVVAVPARVDPDGAILETSVEFDPLAGDAFAAALRERVAVPIQLENDSTAALVSELESGIAAGVADVVLISVSQALTAAVALDGRARRGRNHAVGVVHRLRHGDDTVEDVITTTAVNRALERAGRPVTGWSELLADDGDAVVTGLRTRFVDALALVTASLCVGVDPELVVFDGRMAPMITRTLPELTTALERSLPIVPRLEVTAAGLFASARGAAAIARDAARADLLGELNHARRTARTS